MWSILLNPKNLIIIGLTIALIALGVAFGIERMAKLSLETEVATLQGTIDVLNRAIAERDTIIASLRKHIDAVRIADEAMQKQEEGKSVIRKKIQAIVPQPVSKGGELGEAYASVAADITNMFNTSRVRYKINSSRGGEGASEVLPPPAKAGDKSTEDNR